MNRAQNFYRLIYVIRLKVFRSSASAVALRGGVSSALFSEFRLMENKFGAIFIAENHFVRRTKQNTEERGFPLSLSPAPFRI